MRGIKLNENFKIPQPKTGQTEDEFISGCMNILTDEFPDESQRYAVCKKQWDDR